jgi:hypothetical protein
MTARKPAFDFAVAVRNLSEDIVRKSEALRHVRLEAVAFSITRSKADGPHGMFAKIVPMRFEGGSEILVYKKRRYRMPPLTTEGREILYAIYFCLPKFQNLPFDDKLLTVFHELYHISPEFNGDIRRFPGKNYAHGPSRKAYNDRVRLIVNDYLASDPDLEALAFLNRSADEILENHRGFTAPRILRPKLIPLDPPKRKPKISR